MKARYLLNSDDMELLSESLAPIGMKCSLIQDNKKSRFVNIPCNDELHFLLMKIFLCQNKINYYSQDRLIQITDAQAVKVMKVLEKDASIFYNILTLITSLNNFVKASTINFDFKTSDTHFIYSFHDESHTTIMRDLFPKELTSLKGKSWQLNHEKLFAMKKEKRKNLIANLREREAQCSLKAKNAANLLQLFPRESLIKGALVSDGKLALAIFHEFAAIYAPIFEKLRAKTCGDGVIEIELTEFANLNPVLDLIVERAACKVRLNRFNKFQECLTNISDFNIQCLEDAFNIQYFNPAPNKHVLKAAELSSLHCTLANEFLTFYFDDILSMEDDQYDGLIQNMQAAHAAFIEELSNSEEGRNAQKRYAQELRIVELIKKDDVVSIAAMVKEFHIDVNEALTVSQYFGSTMVLLAASYGSNLVLNWLMQDMTVDFVRPITQGMHTGLTPLFAAATNGNTKAIEMLLRGGANVNEAIAPVGDPTDPKKQSVSHAFCGRTPLTAAVAAGHSEATLCLILNGADYASPITNGSSAGQTPLGLAVMHSHPHVVAILLHYGVDHVFHKTAYTALETAVLINNSKSSEDSQMVVRMIMNENTDMQALITYFENHPLFENLTAYHWAALNNQLMLAIPINTEVSTYLTSFLGANGIELSLGNNNYGYISKSNAKALVELLRNNPKAWSQYNQIMLKIFKCMAVSTYHSAIKLDKKHLAITIKKSPEDFGFATLLKNISEKVGVNGDKTYLVSLTDLINLGIRERITLLLSLDTYLAECKTLYISLQDFIERGFGQKSSLEDWSIDDGRVELKLKDRVAAIARPALNALDCQGNNGNYLLSVKHYQLLSPQKREDILAEIKDRVATLESFNTFSARVGDRKVTYDKATVTLKFNNPADEQRFVRLLKTELPTACLPLNHDDVFALGADKFKALTRLVDNENQLEKLIQLIEILFKHTKTWKHENRLLCFPSDTKIVGIQSALNLAGWSTIAEPTLTACIELQQIYQYKEADFTRIQDIWQTACIKTNIISELALLLNQAKLEFKSNCIAMDLTGCTQRQCFIDTCNDLLQGAVMPANCLKFSYQRILELETEELRNLVTSLRRELDAIARKDLELALKPATVTKTKSPEQYYAEQAATHRYTAATHSEKVVKKPGSHSKKNQNNKKKSPNTNTSTTKATTNKSSRRRSSNVGITTERALPTLRIGKFSDPTLINKTLAAPSVYQKEEAAPVKRTPIQYTNKLFKPISSQDLCLDITAKMNDLWDTVVMINICIENTDDYAQLLKTLHECLIKLGKLGATLCKPSPFNILICDFLVELHQKFVIHSEAPLPSIDEILTYALRGADLWEAWMNVAQEDTIDATLLSMSK